jgi:hypothetical protein
VVTRRIVKGAVLTTSGLGREGPCALYGRGFLEHLAAAIVHQAETHLTFFRGQMFPAIVTARGTAVILVW